MGKPVIVTVGYERRSPDELVAHLISNDVRLLIDVRELPLSRRAGFSKTALGKRLEDSGIEYRHLRAAGNPHRKVSTDPSVCLELYGRYLDANPEVISNVAAELGNRKVAMLCYERGHTSCHRSVLAERLLATGHCKKIIAIE